MSHPNRDRTVCGNRFAANSLDGVYSHGLNRFPFFVDNVKEKLIDMDFKNKKVLITGGCSGIGKIMARKSLERGASNLIIWDINEEGLAKTKAGKNKNIIAMDGALLSGFGPRVGEGVVELNQLLSGNAQ